MTTLGQWCSKPLRRDSPKKDTIGMKSTAYHPIPQNIMKTGRENSNRLGTVTIFLPNGTRTQYLSLEKMASRSRPPGREHIWTDGYRYNLTKIRHCDGFFSKRLKKEVSTRCKCTEYPINTKTIEYNDEKFDSSKGWSVDFITNRLSNSERVPIQSKGTRQKRWSQCIICRCSKSRWEDWIKRDEHNTTSSTEPEQVEIEAEVEVEPPIQEDLSCKREWRIKWGGRNRAWSEIEDLDDRLKNNYSLSTKVMLTKRNTKPEDGCRRQSDLRKHKRAKIRLKITMIIRREISRHKVSKQGDRKLRCWITPRVL